MESINDTLGRTMQSQTPIFEVLDHVDEQEVMFRSICRSGLVSNSGAGGPQREAWHSKSGASRGCL